MSKIHTCDELGVCRGIACPDCDAFECELPCSLEPAKIELYPWPRYPFAPGTIEGPAPAPNPLARDSLTMLLLVLLMVLLGTLLGGVLAGYLHAPAWLFLGWLA